MPLLNFDTSKMPKGKSASFFKGNKPLNLILGIGALVAVIGFGSTLAANINIGTGPIEFGQGIAQTTSCDDSIVLTPTATFVNAPTAQGGEFTRQVGAVGSANFEVSDKTGLYIGQLISSPTLGSGNRITSIGQTSEVDSISGYVDFPNPTTVWFIEFSGGSQYQGPTDETMTFAGGNDFFFSSLTLTGVDSTDQSGPSKGCAGKNFLFKLYKEDGTLIATTYKIYVDADGNFSSSEGEISATRAGHEDSTATLSFNSPSVLSSDVYRITIESSETTFAVFSPSISTTPQTIIVNPVLHLIPTLHPNTGVCTDNEIPGWIRLVAPNSNVYISIYTYSYDSNRDTTLKVYDAAGNFITWNDDAEYPESEQITTDSYAVDEAVAPGPNDVHSALTFLATAGTTYYVGLADCEGDGNSGMPESANVNVGYYYSTNAP